MRAILPLSILAVAGAIGGAAFAQNQPQTDLVGVGDRRISQVIVYGNDPCPPSTEEVVVVCARRPENDRFRIPEHLREPRQTSANTSWAVGARQLEMVGRNGIQSCSTVGPGGFTGCWSEMMRQAREEGRVNEEAQPVP